MLTAMLGNMKFPSSDSTLRVPSNDQVPGLLAELEASGEPLAPFARSRGYSPWKLYEARRKAARAAASTPVFQELSLAPTQSEEPTDASFELTLTGGQVLRIPSDFDAVELRRLLQVIESC